MTRQVKYFAKCRDCDKCGVCPECGQLIPRFSAFSDWLRGLGPPLDSHRVSLHNLDYIWHNYRENWFITIEEKMYGARCTAPQKDTHNLVVSFLKLANDILKMTNGRILTGIGRNHDLKSAEYRGHYVIVFSGTNPDDSESIEVNDLLISKEELLNLLKTGKLVRNFVRESA